MAREQLVRGTGAVTAPRVVAAEMLADLRNGALLDPVFERRTAPLDARDRRWLRELVYGVLRHRSFLDAVLAERVRGGLGQLDDDLLDLLRLGVHQLLRMGSVPAYAAIGQTVELAKRRHGIGASKLANAVLRRVDRERETLAPRTSGDPLEALALEFSHPLWIVQRWVERWGMDETRALLAANNAEAPLIARPVDVSAETLREMLRQSGVETSEAPLLADSVVLASPVTSLTELGAFRQGLFHLQDPASTLVTRYAAPAAGSIVADLCAAPGGKAVEFSRTAGTVIASDVSPERLKRVRENVKRLHTEHVHVLVADARAPSVSGVDMVLVDVPCTGTGTLRRHPDARWRLKPSDLAVLGALQKQILAAASKAVRPGGLLVYSTCSLELEENDDQVEGFLRANPEWTLEPPPEGTVPADALDGGRLRVLPQRHGTDGAFAARMRRAA